MTHSDDLQCQWLSWKAFSDEHLMLEMPAGNRCDMHGVIKVAQMLMPDVVVIDTFAGQCFDMLYERVGDTEWTLFDREAIPSIRIERKA